MSPPKAHASSPLHTFQHAVASSWYTFSLHLTNSSSSTEIQLRRHSSRELSPEPPLATTHR